MECSLCGNDSHEIPHYAFAKKKKKKNLAHGVAVNRARAVESAWLEQDPWSKILAVSRKSPMTLRKSFNPFGLLSHLINRETSAHSAFLLPTVQLYRDIAEIRDGKGTRMHSPHR